VSPSRACASLKSLAGGNENSRPPSWMRKGNILAWCITAQSHMTSPPSSGAMPHMFRKTSGGMIDTTRASNTRGGTSMKVVPVSTRKRTFVGVFL